MYVASGKSRKKVFHTIHCGYTKRILPENMIFFETKEDARKAGYKFCSSCAYMWKYYKKERKQIENFAEKNRLKVSYDDGAIFVETEIGAWKIVTTRKKTIVLYHGNTEQYSGLKRSRGRLEYHYHFQKGAYSETILGYLQYIASHDAWRSGEQNEYRNLPQSTKKQRHAFRRAAKKARSIEILRVYNLLDRLQYEHDCSAGA